MSLTLPDPPAIPLPPHSPPAAAGADDSATAIDWAFLKRQCFDDPALEAELLALYVAAAADTLAALPLMHVRVQDEAAHRLKGASQGIGAWAMASAAAALEAAPPPLRPSATAALAAAFAEVERAIRDRGIRDHGIRAHGTAA